MASLENRTIEDGIVMGRVSTDVVGSECVFAICPVEEWIEFTSEEAEKCAQEALFESGMMSWGVLVWKY